MKHILRSLPILMLAATGVVSCSEDLLLTDREPSETSFTATLGENSPATRTCVDNNEYADGKVGIFWTKNDEIGAFNSANRQANARFTNSLTGMAETAKFTGTIAGGTVDYVYFPYSPENDGKDADALVGELPMYQTFSTSDGSLYGDYKIGTPKAGSKDEFTFEHLFTLLKVEVNADGTEAAGDRLVSVSITSKARRLNGKFTFSAISGNPVFSDKMEDGADRITMKWSDKPVMRASNTLKGYITCAPNIKQGDELEFLLVTDKRSISFMAKASVDFEANTAYTVPLTLGHFNDEKYGWTVSKLPQMTSFGFKAALNSGKILDRELYRNNQKTSNRATEGVDLPIDRNDIKGVIPYLNDRNLVASFEVSEGCTVTVDGIEQISGETEVNFSKPVVYTVTSADGKLSNEYTVSLSNTGLPVVVINSGGNSQWTEAGVDYWSKETDWQSDATVKIYNADGSMDTGKKGGVHDKASVRIRGNSTQEFPKKPFAIKLDKKDMVLGMPAHKRWVLLANWKDRSLMRNAIAFDIANLMGEVNGALSWNPHGRFVELVYNGVHVGNYYLCEQIKIDPDSRPITTKPAPDLKDGMPNTDEELANYGYLLECDDFYDEQVKFTTKHYIPFMFKDDANDRMLNYVKNKALGIESNLMKNTEAGYSAAYEELDLLSVIDYWLIIQLTMNDELKHPKSVFMAVDGKGKLKAGPVWDFDWLAFPIIESMPSKQDYKYKYDKTLEEISAKHYYTDKDVSKPLQENWTNSNEAPYMWYPMLFKDTKGFRPMVKSRWNKAKGALQGYAPKIYDMGQKIALSVSYNDAMWPVNEKDRSDINLGSRGFCGDESLSFEKSVEGIYNAFLKRIEGMSSFIDAENYPDIKINKWIF